MQMKTKFQLDGTNVSILKINEDLLTDKLASRIYTVKFNPLAGFYLEVKKDRLDLPSQIYGVANIRADKCIRTYRDREASTGVLMTGDKGTGKTLLMSLLANRAADEFDLPVLLIKEPYSGEQFTSFIETIGECVLVFDEFGKMYKATNHSHTEHDVPQQSLLSLLDGTDKTKRLIIMTENSEIDINDFMLNRPSRIFYHFKYKKLDEDSIRGYCNDNKVKAKFTNEVVDLSRRTRIFSFDMLQSIVEEHLRFDCNLEEATADLNIDTREDTEDMMEIVKVINRETDEEVQLVGNKKVKLPTEHDCYTWIQVMSGNNVLAELAKQADIEIPEELEDMEEMGHESVHFEYSDLAYEEYEKLVFETEKYSIVAKKLPNYKSSYSKFF